MRVFWVIPNGMLYGGIKKVIENAIGLKMMGHTSCIIMRDDVYDPQDWYGDIDVPILGEEYLRENITDSDLIILTWKGDCDLLHLNGAHSVFYCQDVNHENQNDDLDKLIEGADSIVVTTTYLYNFLNENYLLKNVRAATKIPCGVDSSIFYEDESARAERAIFIPRKTKGMKTIISLWNSKERNLPLEPVGGMPKGNYGDGSTLLTPLALADEYRKSYVYITASANEPFGLTPLEAMACGCIVVGWDGKGGADFMHDGVNAIVAENGDRDSLLEKMDRVDDLVENRPSRLDKMRREALKTANKFSLENERLAWDTYLQGLELQ